MTDNTKKILTDNAKETLENTEVTETTVTLINLNSTIRDYPILKGSDDENNLDTIKNTVTTVTAVTDRKGGGYSGNRPNSNSVTSVTELLNNAIDPNDTPPPIIEKIELKRPCYGVYDDFNEFGKAGVYHHTTKSDKKGNLTPVNDFICDPLHVDAGSCDALDHNYGLMLRFKNQRNRWRKWLMPLEMLSGSCEELRGELLKQGLRIDHNKRNMLPSYLQSQRPNNQLECALKVGWHGDVFVLPNRVIGVRDDVFFQTDHAITAEYSQRGTLNQWQDNVSLYCIENPLLLFQVSISFAGALLKKCHIDYAGFHFFGGSSIGKSTGHKAAGSVWGGENFRRSWKATGNGLEAAAVLFNDCLLALDELGDSDPREVNQIIYALGNGTGKQRASVKGSARAVSKWRIVLLSNGEKTLESHFQEKGLAVKAGQLVRLLQIPVFGKYGAFDNLHGMKDGRLFSDTLQKNASEYYGTAGIAYLQKLVYDKDDLGGLLDKAIQGFRFDDMQPQEQRASRSFALVALAGELATSYGVTGWKEGDALQAALTCFKHWRNHRGKGSTENKVILEAISDFINRHSDTRFTPKVENSITISQTRAGWYIDEPERDRMYLFTSAGIKDASVGHDLKLVIDVLTRSGWLIRNEKDGYPTKGHKIQGRNQKLYQVIIKEGDL
jgi:putative DNA primase/helicase